jgi:LmbE family N-acetylglucosaminyl deacetylase
MTRRKLLRWGAGGVFAHALLARGQQSSEKAPTPPDVLPGAEKNRKLKVVFVGAHVDDWTVCAGTLARYTREGHEVLCFSFTPGDSMSMANGLHMPVEDLAAQRRGDAVRGTQIIGAQFKILDQHNQEMHVDPQSYLQFNKTLAAEKPDVVFGMWPIEYHPDHRAAANLAFNAWLQGGMKFDFYFSETQEASEMSPQLFTPSRWVDIASVMELKHQSVIANSFIKDSWPESEMWAEFRGREYGCRYAEAFVHLATVGTIKPPENPVPGLWSSGLDLARD